MSEELKRIGANMANVMFNLAQKAGEPLDGRACEIMEKLQLEWDAASTRTASDTRTAAAADSKSHPYHRDLEGLNEFINGFCQGDARLIACAEAAWYRCIGRNHALNHAAGEAECDAARRAAPADQQDAGGVVLSALRDGIPLQEPVYINKALRAQREARVSLSGGTGPQACVMLVNIQLTGWIHTKDTAEAYAEGYNRGRKDYRSALLELAAQISRDAATRSREDGGNTQARTEFLAHLSASAEIVKTWPSWKQRVWAEDAATTRPAEVDVEAERKLYLKAFPSFLGYGWTSGQEDKFKVWLAARTQADAGKEREQYNELLYAVERKFPGESRHETALRYIRAAETASASVGAGAQIAEGE